MRVKGVVDLFSLVKHNWRSTFELSLSGVELKLGGFLNALTYFEGHSEYTCYGLKEDLDCACTYLFNDINWRVVSLKHGENL